MPAATSRASHFDLAGVATFAGFESVAAPLNLQQLAHRDLGSAADLVGQLGVNIYSVIFGADIGLCLDGVFTRAHGEPRLFDRQLNSVAAQWRFTPVMMSLTVPIAPPIS